ncbi:MAG: hypothetical protein ACI85F_001844 [Bacteroidia bacterium]|jgi:hypothetical protein
MGNLYQLLYTSKAREELDAEELCELLNETSNNNTSARITGMLILRDGVFLQMLEGEKESVLEIFSLIKEDSRHGEVVILSDESIEEREFDNYRMCFDSSFEKTFKQMPNYSTIKETRSILETVSTGKTALNALKNMVA